MKYSYFHPPAHVPKFKTWPFENLWKSCKTTDFLKTPIQHHQMDLTEGMLQLLGLRIETSMHCLPGRKCKQTILACIHVSFPQNKHGMAGWYLSLYPEAKMVPWPEAHSVLQCLVDTLHDDMLSLTLEMTFKAAVTLGDGRLTTS